MFAQGAIKLDGYYRFKFHEREGFKDYPEVPMYSNWRVVQSQPMLRSFAISLLTDVIAQRDLEFDFVSGVPMGGLWISYGISERLNCGHLLLREPKSHGLSAKIDGLYEAGNIALPVEDVTSTSESVQTASLRLRDNGLRVTTALSIQNYDLGATAALAAIGIDLVSALFLPDILEAGRAFGVAETKIDEVDRYFTELRKHF
jgi:orotate phosphoribosyltransferase